jgi:biopolymer transport protein ExbD
MDKRQVDVERVSANLESILAEQPTETVIIQADKEAKHGVVVKVMDQIKATGDNLKISIAGDK